MGVNFRNFVFTIIQWAWIFHVDIVCLCLLICVWVLVCVGEIVSVSEGQSMNNAGNKYSTGCWNPFPMLTTWQAVCGVEYTWLGWIQPYRQPKRVQFPFIWFQKWGLWASHCDNSPIFQFCSAAPTRPSFLHVQLFTLTITVPTVPMLSQLESSLSPGYLSISKVGSASEVFPPYH